MGIKRQSTDDRLSDLPDDVISHVLSFLTTKESAQTCVLAKRWRSLWAQVPCLDFDLDDYSKGSLVMSRIINRVLLRRKGLMNINSFSLNHGSCRSDEFEAWIESLIAHHVQNLSISLYFQFFCLHAFFSCKTLVDLCLRECLFDFPTKGIVEFPSLKKLRLDLVMYLSNSSFENLLSGCPVLEELIIVKESSYINVLVCCFRISSPTLKRLDIDSNKKLYDVKLNTPALTYLRLHEFVTSDFSPLALTSLTEADIVFYRSERYGITACVVLQFVGSLYNVKSLRLTTCSMDDDDSAFSTTKKFHNLTNLVLEADWHFISLFLENAEILKVLDIRMSDRRVIGWTEPNQVVVCVSSHLSKVTVREFGFTEGEFELVRYLLTNGKVMKLMEIYLKHGADGDHDKQYCDAAVETISKYCRGSDACELVFHPRTSVLNLN